MDPGVLLLLLGALFALILERLWQKARFWWDERGLLAKHGTEAGRRKEFIRIFGVAPSDPTASRAVEHLIASQVILVGTAWVALKRVVSRPLPENLADHRDSEENGAFFDLLDRFHELHTFAIVAGEQSEGSAIRAVLRRYEVDLSASPSENESE